MTKREFELAYGILRPYINEGIRMTKTKPVQEGEYREIDLVKAVATFFQARRDRMLTRAKGWRGGPRTSRRNTGSGIMGEEQVVIPVESWQNKTVINRVCRAMPSGGGPIICGRECESYTHCRIGQEYVKRGLDQKRGNRKGRKPKPVLSDSETALLKRLKQIRQECGLSREDMAKRCNIAASTIKSWESGQNTPSMGILMTVLERLGYELVIRRKTDGT